MADEKVRRAHALASLISHYVDKHCKEHSRTGTRREFRIGDGDIRQAVRVLDLIGLNEIQTRIRAHEVERCADNPVLAVIERAIALVEEQGEIAAFEHLADEDLIIVMRSEDEEEEENDKPTATGHA